MPLVAWRAARPGDVRRALAWAGIVVLAVALAPLAGAASAFLPECNFHRWTGVACPSCGATRALLALARGRVGAAFGWNPLVVLLAAALAVGAVATPIVVAAARRVPVLAGPVPRAAWWILVAAVAANWAYLVLAGV